MARGKGIRSDIPYKDRLLMQKYNSIREHRDDASRTALKISCVALNNTKKMGYFQLVQFAEEQQRLTDEYYADPEVQEKHLNDRLHKIGFVTKDGRLLGAVDADGKPVKATDLPEEDVLNKVGGERRNVQLWSNWISIKDKLPDAFQPVIVCRMTSDGEYKVEQGFRDVNGWWKVYGTRTKAVEYWMPLPKPPVV